MKNIILKSVLVATHKRQWWLWGIFSCCAVAILTGLRLIAEAPFSWPITLGHILFSATLLFPLPTLLPRVNGKFAEYGALHLGLLAVGGIVVSLYAGTNATWAAWGTVWFIYLFLMRLNASITTGQAIWCRWGLRIMLLGIGGLVPIVIAQVETRFSEEEFFVALQAVGLSLYWAVLLWGRTQIEAAGAKWDEQPATAFIGWRMRWGWVWGMIGVLGILGMWGTIVAYQHSFYPDIAPTYPGITTETPFLCGESAPSIDQVFEGYDVFQRLLDRVAAHPRKGPPEYGMLTLGTSSADWADRFRDTLLAEAEAQRFAGPAHSVKWIQYQAALRVYYYARVQEQRPTLFSDQERTLIQTWFANINRRTLTVEWVDWMYGLAFSQWPEGPYENQENGAGLLALLEAESLSAPELSETNRDYLARNPRGWEARFHNTDDAFSYQLEWINNAYFQALYTGTYSETLQRQSFEWLLLQALPDGQALTYNYPHASSLAGVAYLGATLTQDPQYLWLAGQALSKLEAEDGYLSAQPGVDSPLSMQSVAPTQGSCLIYADSGLPTQKGPLAPDKIVFRDGWSDVAMYALLDLRFTGWHRYKATNTMSLVYNNEILASEQLAGETFSWLPEGRSLFRDKRVPRENLNALSVSRTGMDAVLYALSGFGGPWAQDPPYYAEIVDFQTSADVDWAHTRMDGWHDRWVYAYHQHRPLVVIDAVDSTAPHPATLLWHLRTSDNAIRDGVTLADGYTEVQFLALQSETMHITSNVAPTSDYRTITATSTSKVPLSIATIFLWDQWRDANIAVDTEAQVLYITQESERIEVPLPTSTTAP